MWSSTKKGRLVHRVREAETRWRDHALTRLEVTAFCGDTLYNPALGDERSPNLAPCLTCELNAAAPDSVVYIRRWSGWLKIGTSRQIGTRVRGTGGTLVAFAPGTFSEEGLVVRRVCSTLGVPYSEAMAWTAVREALALKVLAEVCGPVTTAATARAAA